MFIWVILFKSESLKLIHSPKNKQTKNKQLGMCHVISKAEENNSKFS